jgi:hypothetical protein
MDNNPVAAVREKVQRYLIDLLQSIQIDRDGDFNFRHGSAHVYVRVHPLGEAGTYVSVWAPTNGDVPVTPDLYKYIVEQNHYRFGHLACTEKDGKAIINFTHQLLGDFLDPDELKMAVVVVARTADEVDDQIKAKFGGRTFHEA